MSDEITKPTDKKPLGRGLSNLFQGLNTLDPNHINISENPNYKELPIEQVFPNPNQPRKLFEEKEMSDLLETIQEVGLIEPIVVRFIKEKEYQIIAGERRYRAAIKAGFKKIPSIIKQANEIQALELGIIENIQRQELNPIEEARAYLLWMESTQEKMEVLARKVGKDRSTIKNLIRLLKLPEEIQILIEKKVLTVGQARPLLSIGDPQLIKKIAKKIINENWNSRRVEDEVGKMTETKKVSYSTEKDKDANSLTLEKKLRARFSAKVTVNHKKNGSGNITLHYGNLNDLDRLLESMGL